ncbi:MAG: site-specific integrase [Flavobacterium sp.]|nr:site-specific integrase [Flavobacterium sp.]
MRDQNLALIFFLKNNRPGKNGELPIYFRITIGGKRIETSTSKYVLAENWDSKKGRIKIKTTEACSINGYLDTLRAKVFETESLLIRKQIPVNMENYRDYFYGKAETPAMILEVFTEHNIRMQMLIGKEFTKATLKKYKTTFKHVQDFIKHKYKKKDLPVTNINIKFLNDLDFHIRTVKNCNNNSSVKYVRNFGKIVRWCYSNDLIEKDPFVHYKAKFHEVVIEPLDQAELQRIKEVEPATERLMLVRDLYLFSCYTGLAYVDLEKLTPDNISIGIDGRRWIFTHRQKTEVPSNIPLLPVAEQILEKYSDHPKSLQAGKLLPVLSNQKLNTYLKELADICRIKKHITFHTARHTFATTVTLANGVPMESVSKMLGHRSIRTTQHYAKIVDQKVGQDMERLRQQLDAATAKKQLSSS